MPQTAIISPQIIDSTSIGRDLITAADQAAAQAIIGVTGVDTSEDYTWTGDHTFDGSATFTSVFDAVNGEFSGTVTADELKATLDTGGSLILRGSTDTYIDVADGVMNFYCNTGQAFRMTSSNVETYKTLKPISTQDLGSTTSRWPNSYFVDGSFSGNLISEVGGSYKLYNLGTEGDADTEYLETSFATNVALIESKGTGTGVGRELRLVSGTSSLKLEAFGLTTLTASSKNLLRGNGAASTYLYSYNQGTIVEIGDGEFIPFTASVGLGSDTNRWSNTYSVDGDFSGTVTIGGSIDNTDANDLLSVSFSGTEQYSFRTNALVPKNIAKSLGLAVARWTTGYFTNGSFSGNLINEVGGSYKLYNLGTEGDADTEYLSLDADSNQLRILSSITGTGVLRDIRLGGYVGVAYRGLRIQPASGGMQFIYNNAVRLSVDSSTTNISTSTTVIQNLRPAANDTYYSGTTSLRWSNVASVDGDFSGNMTLSNLPTSDPVVAGQLWNDSGTVKISAG